MTPTLAELVTLLAGRRVALATFQDDAERLIEHCEAVEAECEALSIKIGAVAVATGEAQPHAAVKVIPHTGEEPDVPRVEIERDLSEYL